MSIKARMLFYESKMRFPALFLWATHLESRVECGRKESPALNPSMIPLKFSASPLWWQSCISVPDEADKVLLGREGGLLFDYERKGTGHRGFRTVIEPGLLEEHAFRAQSLEDPRTPIVTTSFGTDGLKFEVEVFAVVPPDVQYDAVPVIRREGGEEAIEGWDGPRVPRVKRGFSQPVGPGGPEFLDAAWGADGQEIVYEIRVPTGSVRTLMLGFAEGEYDIPGRRILKIATDGSLPLIFDPADLFGKDRPGLCGIEARDTDRDGVLRVRVSAAEGSPDRSSFLNAIWVFRDSWPSENEIFSGKSAPEAFADCGRPAMPRRQYMMRLRVENHSGRTATCYPILRVRSLERVQMAGDRLRIGSGTEIVTGHLIAALRAEEGCHAAILTPMSLPAGGSADIFLSVNRHGYQSKALNLQSYEAGRNKAREYWASLPLPYGVMSLPEPRLQALLDSSIRNIYQARDIQGGLPAFHVGPTCYRQLWIVDGAFLLETVTLLGRADEARAGIAYMLGFQQADGGFQLKARYWKETGIVLWAVVRQAMLTGDKEWLRSVWPQVVSAVDFIIRLRGSERAGDPSAPEFRLAPYGDIDGGISNMGEGEKLPEYSNTYWLLTGLKAACEAARWIGEETTAWCAEFEDFFRVFQAAAARDIQVDQHGNRFLPVQMGGTSPPQKAQWAFCHAVHPGMLFERFDPFVTGMLDMLESCKVEGLVLDTGWMPGGLWSYFASFYGHARLWQGDASGAFSALESFADHASPMLVWREEQKPEGRGKEEVGDMPHNWAGAEFIRLAFHLIAIERGDELHLFQGIPSAWIQPGNEISIHGAATVFGPLTATLTVSGTEILIHVEPLARFCEGIVIHSSAWDEAEPLKFPANRAVVRKIGIGPIATSD